MESTVDKNVPVSRIISYLNEGNFTVGDRLPTIRQLSENLDLRRNEVRDGLLQAEALGLVAVRPRAGTFVRSVDFGSMVSVLDDTLQTIIQQNGQSVFELMEARRAVELELSRLAAQRRRPAELAQIRAALVAIRPVYGQQPEYLPANEKFHLAVAEAGGNKVLFAVLRSMLTMLRPSIAHSIAAHPPDQAGVARDEDEHEAIYQAVLEGDPDRASAAMGYHLKELTRWLASRD